MAKYKVVNQPVEINGVTYQVGAEVPEAEFLPISKAQKDEKKRREDAIVEAVQPVPKVEEPLSELDSLLKTGHIKPV